MSSATVSDRSDRGATSSGAMKKTNKALALKSAGSWIPENQSCKVCKVKTMKNYKYCNNCAHKKGNCRSFVCLLVIVLIML
jgi:hypothetical protein